MDYPDRKRKPKREPHDIPDKQEPELRLAEFSAPCGEEFPWRTAEAEFPELAGARVGQKPERGRLH